MDILKRATLVKATVAVIYNRQVEIRGGTVQAAEKKTWVSILFQYKPKENRRPLDFVQEKEIAFESPYGESIAAVPIPAVGDSVAIKLEEHGVYKVLTRHFVHLHSDVGLSVTVNIVVTDLDEVEHLARIKE
jgi:hypothetical protein